MTMAVARVLYQPTKPLTDRRERSIVIAGHRPGDLSRHMLDEMAGSVACHDGVAGRVKQSRDLSAGKRATTRAGLLMIVRSDAYPVYTAIAHATTIRMRDSEPMRRFVGRAIYG